MGWLFFQLNLKIVISTQEGGAIGSVLDSMSKNLSFDFKCL